MDAKKPGLLGAFFAPTVVALAVLSSWATRVPPKPSPYRAVADFSLVNQRGEKVTRKDLEGHPWVVDFVFTRCGGPCPRLSEAMEKLQAGLKRTDARLVSISVDPEHDTPAVLAEYAKAHHAGDNWLFLTGDVGAISSLVYESFNLPMTREPGAPVGQLVTHSSRMILVDRTGQIRAHYQPLDHAPEGGLVIVDEQLAQLDHDLKAFGNGSPLPLVNASLNATCTLLLVLGYVLIRAGKTGAHATVMLGALGVSAVFLAFYLYYHLLYASTPFSGEGPAKALYLAILIPHIILAVPTVVLAIGTALLGLRGRFERHRAWARITFPIWIYVSVTGVAVYALLYEIHRP